MADLASCGNQRKNPHNAKKTPQPQTQIAKEDEVTEGTRKRRGIPVCVISQRKCLERSKKEMQSIDGSSQKSSKQDLNEGNGELKFVSLYLVVFGRFMMVVDFLEPSICVLDVIPLIGMCFS